MTADRAADGAPVPLRHNRDYLYLWGGQAVSVLGSQASRVAYPLLVLALTHSPGKAGFAGAAATLPYLIFPLLAGGVADRHDRKRIMIACDVLRLVALASIALAGLIASISYTQVLVAGFAEGVGTVFYSLANRGAVPMLVHHSQRTTALAQIEARTYGAQLAGPALGGALFGVSRVLPFAADALSYVASLATLRMIRAPMQERGPSTPRASSPRDLRRELAEGLAWTWQHPFLRISSLLAGSVNICLQILSLGIIVLAKADGAAPALIGVIIGCMGAGGLVGAFSAAWLQRHVRPGVIITGCLWAWAVLIALLAVVPSPLWLCPVAAGIGLAGSPWNVAVQSYRLRITPNRMLARASSVSLQIAWGAIPLGSLLAGVLLESLSPDAVMGIVAAAVAVTAVAATAAPTMRHAGSPRDPWLSDAAPAL